VVRWVQEGISAMSLLSSEILHVKSDLREVGSAVIQNIYYFCLEMTYSGVSDALSKQFYTYQALCDQRSSIGQLLGVLPLTPRKLL